MGVDLPAAADFTGGAQAMYAGRVLPRPEDAIRERSEFVAESRDLVEKLGRELHGLDAAHGRGETGFDTLREIFRLVHGLKGISAMFGARALATLTHALEDVLDGLLRQRIQLSRELVAHLFSAVDLADGLVERPDTIDPAEVDRRVRALRPETPYAGPSVQSLSLGAEQYALDPALLAALTEYEELRLQRHLSQGTALFGVRIRSSLATLDGTLEDFRHRMRPLGEIITLLPAAVGADGTVDDAPEVDVLLASSASIEDLRAVTREDNWVVHAIPRPSLPTDAREQEESSLADRSSTHGRTLRPGPADGASLPPDAKAAAPAPERTVRIATARLDELFERTEALSRIHGTLRGMAERSSREPPTAADLRALALDLDRGVASVRGAIVAMREIPLRSTIERLVREIDRLAVVQRKELRVVTAGLDTVLDAAIVDALPPLMLHLVRNAVDHGIEVPSVRRARTKPTAGTVSIRARRTDAGVAIEIEDDGGGIDTAAVVRAGARMGIAVPTGESNGEAKRAHELIFMPGLSTTATVTEISGRGIGLDAVRAGIVALGGTITLDSEPGVYTRWTLSLPTTVSMLSILVVEAAERAYGIPLAAVTRVLRVESADLHEVDGRWFAGDLPVCDLAAWMGHRDAGRGASRPWRVVVRMHHAGRDAGCLVDAAHGIRDVMLRPLGPSPSDFGVFDGMAELGERGSVLVLSPTAVIAEALSTHLEDDPRDA